MAAAAATVLLVAPAAARAVTVSSVERTELHLINSFRAQHGLKKLRLDKRLTKDAKWMGHDMPAYSYFDHVDHLSRDPFARMDAFDYPDNTWRGENLAAGYADAQDTFQQWENSPPHRENMLTSEYRAIGIARVCESGSQYDCYWVTEFGSKVVKPLA
jgi:uncharacterized protein YkwD